MKVNVNVDIWPVTTKYKFQRKCKIEIITTYVHTCILSNSFLFVRMEFVPGIRSMMRDLAVVTNRVYYSYFICKKENYF